MFSGLQTKTISAKKDVKSSAFKILLGEILAANGDFSKVREVLRKS
jgi:hypothetical protein